MRNNTPFLVLAETSREVRDNTQFLVLAETPREVRNKHTIPRSSRNAAWSAQ